MTDKPAIPEASNPEELPAESSTFVKSDIRYWGKVLGLKEDADRDSFTKAKAKETKSLLSQLPTEATDFLSKFTDTTEEEKIVLEKVVTKEFQHPEKRWWNFDHLPVWEIDEGDARERLQYFTEQGLIAPLARYIELGGDIDIVFVDSLFKKHKGWQANRRWIQQDIQSIKDLCERGVSFLETVRDAGFSESLYATLPELFVFNQHQDMFGSSDRHADFSKSAEVFDQLITTNVGNAVSLAECISFDPKERLIYLRSIVDASSLRDQSGEMPYGLNLDHMNIFAELIDQEVLSIRATEQQRRFWRFFVRCGTNTSYLSRWGDRRESIVQLRALRECKTLSEGLKWLWPQACFVAHKLEEEDLDVLPSREKEFWILFKRLPDSFQRQIIKEHVSLEEVDPHEMEAAVVWQELSQSHSKELSRVRDLLLEPLSRSDNPRRDAELIRGIFDRNNLPWIGKVFEVFKLLYPPDKIEREFVGYRSAKLSPILMEADASGRYEIIYRDLLKVYINSAEPSLYSYLEALQEGQVVFDKARRGEDLSKGEKSKLIHFLDRMDTLYASSLYGRTRKADTTLKEDIPSRIQKIADNFGLIGDQSLTQRVALMFLGPLGYSNIEQVLKAMRQAKTHADQRNRALYESSSEGFKFSEGDLIKAFEADIFYSILQKGPVAGEYIGGVSNSDETPFDTDFFRFSAQGVTVGIRDAFAVESVITDPDFPLIMVIKAEREDRQFQLTRKDKWADNMSFQKGDIPRIKYEQDKYELFYSGFLTNEHYAIRTGIASTDIDYIILKKTDPATLQQIYSTIALNGFYIPVVDMDGNVLFTPNDYREYRIQTGAVTAALISAEFDPQALINSLKSSPYLRRLFEGSVGGWERESLEKHTRKVLAQYKKYVAGKFSSDILFEEAFILTLLLHDIGKPLALKEEGNTDSQHEYTMRFLPQILQGFGLSSHETDIIASIVSQDYLGQYIQGNVDAENTGRAIYERAQSLGVPVDDFFELMLQYYKCDASAYTTDAEEPEDAGSGSREVSAINLVFSFDNGSISFTSEVEDKVSRLKPYINLSS